jgi:hypothetical protein
MATKKRMKRGDVDKVLDGLRSDVRAMGGFAELARQGLEQVEEALRPANVKNIKGKVRGKVRDALHRRVDELLPDED